MARMLSPDDKCVEVDVPVGRGRRYRGQAIEVTDLDHARALRKAGYTLADTAGAPIRADGFVCSGCGFKAYFRTCSRCGGACERPVLVV